MGEYKPFEDLSNAIILAATAHLGQVDKGGEPYILHPLAVMQSVAPDVRAMIVAVLHDVIEDTSVTAEELMARFPMRIVEAVLLLSKEPVGVPSRPTYREYIERLAQNDLARKVKFADLQHNLLPERLSRLPGGERSIAEKYSRALKILEKCEEEGCL